MENRTVFVGVWDTASALALSQFLASHYLPSEHSFPRLLTSPTISSHGVISQLSALYRLTPQSDSALSSLETECDGGVLYLKVNKIFETGGGLCLLAVNFLKIICWMTQQPDAVVFTYPDMTYLTLQAYTDFMPTLPTPTVPPPPPTPLSPRPVAPRPRPRKYHLSPRLSPCISSSNRSSALLPTNRSGGNSGKAAFFRYYFPHSNRVRKRGKFPVRKAEIPQ